MHEQDRSHPIEIAIDTVKHVGSFIKFHVQGGAWGELSRYKPESLTDEQLSLLDRPYEGSECAVTTLDGV